ncbi:MAG: hypothetical protein ACRD1K_07570 [Acidimicrobiales bacterium]
MGDRQAKDPLFDAFAGVARAMASGRPVEIVDLLSQGERSRRWPASSMTETATCLRSEDASQSAL